MSKVFQILNGFCYYDATKLYSNAEEARQYYSPDTVFVDAPDYVFESWGFDETKEGDERFIQPIPPDGWIYDPETGTFYPEGELPPNQQPTQLDLIEAQVTYTAMMTDTLLEG